MRRLLPTLARSLATAFASWRLLGLLLAFNLAFAVVAVMPVASTLNRMLTPLGDWRDLLVRWPAWLDADFQSQAAGTLTLFHHQSTIILLLFTLLSAFLTAGVMGVLHDADGAFSLGGFSRGCGRYGFAFLRLLFIFLVAAWILAWWAGAQLGAAVEALRFNWGSQRGASLLTLAHQVVVLSLFYLLTWAMEMSRVRLVVEKRRSALGAFAAGLSLTGRSLGPVATIFGTLSLLQVAFLALAGWGFRHWAPGTWWSLALFFLAGQLVIGGRIAFRIAGLECGRRWLTGSRDEASEAGAAG